MRFFLLMLSALALAMACGGDDDGEEAATPSPARELREVAETLVGRLVLTGDDLPPGLTTRKERRGAVPLPWSDECSLASDPFLVAGASNDISADIESQSFFSRSVSWVGIFSTSAEAAAAVDDVIHVWECSQASFSNLSVSVPEFRPVGEKSRTRRFSNAQEPSDAHWTVVVAHNAQVAFAVMDFRFGTPTSTAYLDALMTELEERVESAFAR